MLLSKVVTLTKIGVRFGDKFLVSRVQPQPARVEIPIEG